MPLIAISFLGTSDYTETTYSWQQEKYTTQFFSEAVETFFQPDIIILCCTQAAQQKHAEFIRAHPHWRIENIPEGKTEDELWEIFKIISNNIGDSSELIIDITYGLRSLPFIAISICQFVQVAKKEVKIRDIVYGAFEARENNIAPVFSMKSFLSIIDWSIATKQFTTMGNVFELSQILRDTQAITHKENKESKAQNLSKVANNLQRFHESLSLVRTGEIMSSSANIMARLLDVQKDIKEIPTAAPLGNLLDKIKERVEPIRTYAEEPVSSRGWLIAQAEAVHLLLQTQQYQQAITLARELLISLCCYTNNIYQDAEDKYWEQRKDMEKYVGRLISSRKEKRDIMTDIESEPLQWIISEKYIMLFGKISDIRNDINHAGMRKEPQEAGKAKGNVCKYCCEIIEEVKKITIDDANYSCASSTKNSARQYDTDT